MQTDDPRAQAGCLVISGEQQVVARTRKSQSQNSSIKNQGQWQLRARGCLNPRRAKFFCARGHNWTVTSSHRQTQHTISFPQKPPFRAKSGQSARGWANLQMLIISLIIINDVHHAGCLWIPAGVLRSFISLTTLFANHLLFSHKHPHSFLFLGGLTGPNSSVFHRILAILTPLFFYYYIYTRTPFNTFVPQSLVSQQFLSCVSLRL